MFGFRFWNQLGQIVFDLTDDTINTGAIISLNSASGIINYSPSAGKSVFVEFLSGGADWSYNAGVITYTNATIGSLLYYGSK